mmetsp:Transcript_49778/g.83396  ORF Transcript_49778/g.83396 Transcript_49778/m.83396 type:complete len:84 (-) Transcript_49778:2713-2964(-)
MSQLSQSTIEAPGLQSFSNTNKHCEKRHQKGCTGHNMNTNGSSSLDRVRHRSSGVEYRQLASPPTEAHSKNHVQNNMTATAPS